MRVLYISGGGHELRKETLVVKAFFSDGPPTRSDLDLHARLLAQLESACQSVHNIFFKEFDFVAQFFKEYSFTQLFFLGI